MEDVSSKDLNQFYLWYSQAGTPVVQVNSKYDAEKETLTLHLTQVCFLFHKQLSKSPYL